MSKIYSKDELKQIIINCYQKLKSFIYFNATMSYLNIRIAEFEDNQELFYRKLEKLSNAIYEQDSSYFNKLFNNIDFLILPKNIEYNKDNKTISNRAPHDASVNVNKINFYIDGPIELFVLDVFFTLELGVILEKDSVYSKCNYANKLHREVKDSSGNINYRGLNLFTYYFGNYKKWKNNAIKRSKEFYDDKKDSSIISMDITSFYYCVDGDILKILKNNGYDFSDNPLISFLIILFQNVFDIFSCKIKQYRFDIHFKSILPIGLCSSMLLANLYLKKFDRSANTKFKFYGRYVDDIIIVLDTCDYKNFNDFVDGNSDLFSKTSEGYIIKEFPDLVIKENKCRVLNNYKSGSSEIFTKLYTEEYSISEYNLFPSFNANVEKLINEVYEKQEYIKFREFHNISINPSNIKKIVSGLLLSLKGTNLPKTTKAKFSKNLYYHLNNIDIINLIFKWDQLFLLFCVLENGLYAKTFYGTLKSSINKLIFKTEPSDKIYYKKGTTNKKHFAKLTAKMIESCHVFRQNALAQYVSISYDSYFDKFLPTGLAKKYRFSNLMNFRAISYPLLNYVNDNDIDLRNIEFETYISLIESGFNDFKVKFSPYHISLNDYLLTKELVAVVTKGHYTFEELYSSYYQEIGNIFDSCKENIVVNNPKNSDTNMPTPDYVLENFDFSAIAQESANKIDKKDVRIALAGINLENFKIIKKENGIWVLNKNKLSQKSKESVIDLLNDAYSNDFDINSKNVKKAGKIDEKKSNNKNKTENNSVSEFKKTYDKKAVNYVVFPESFLPIEWFHLVDKFSRETQSIITTGIRYFEYKGKTFNLVAVEVPYIDKHYHKQACIFIRNKNVIPLYERNIIHKSGSLIDNQIINYYFTITKDDVTFSPLICYESTDVVARSLLKNNIHYAFTIAFNKDTNYFRSIGQATSRDLSCFYIECNSSNYGSTSFAPYRSQYLPIASNKGDSRSHMQIISTNLEALIEYKNGYNDAYEKFLDYDFESEQNPSLQFDKEKSKFKKPSANIK